MGSNAAGEKLWTYTSRNTIDKDNRVPKLCKLAIFESKNNTPKKV